MISRTRQNWEPGQSVKVGFLTLTVVQCIPTPGDYAPDAYILINSGQNQLYKFVPHNGLTKLSLTDANDLIASSVDLAAAATRRAIAKAAA